MKLSPERYECDERGVVDHVVELGKLSGEVVADICLDCLRKAVALVEGELK